MYSVLLKDGLIVDGSGSASFQADVAIRGDKIVALAPDIHARAEVVIDANGLVVCPGFIDIHTHTDRSIFEFPLAESKLMQGVTTEVTGNCGISLFPVHPARKSQLEIYLNVLKGALPSDGLSWVDFSGFAAAVENTHPSINLAPLVGHGSLRIAAMGSDDRKPTSEELNHMGQLLADSLQQGAWGMSTGLIYPPGSFAKTEELIYLANVLSRFDAIYTTHVRGESSNLHNAIAEAIRIGKESGTRVQVSHLKAIGKPNWGKAAEALAHINRLRCNGMDIWADQYPYDASSTSLLALIPPWAQDGGTEVLLQRLEKPDLKQRLLQEITEEIHVRGGEDHILLSGVSKLADQQWAGKTIADLARSWDTSGSEAVIRILTATRGGASAVYFSLGTNDIEAIMQDPNVCVGSDGYGVNPSSAEKAIHPRSYGTFPRVFSKYVRDKNLLTIETAVRKMTSLPAMRMGMLDRGILRENFAADITVFNPATIQDRADYTHPHQYATGIEYVLVNGGIALSNGKILQPTHGKVLRKPKTNI